MASENVTTSLGSGGRVFIRELDGSYKAATGDYGKLSVVDGTYRIRESDGTVTAFSSDGRVDFVGDPHGNRITAEYAGSQLTGLVHSNGSRLTLAYNEQGRLREVVDPAGRTTTYEYDITGEYLVRVVTDVTGSDRYTYETDGTPQRQHALLSVAAPGGTGVDYTYDTAGRVEHQALRDGSEAVTFAYDTAGGVTVTNAAGDSNVLLFDDRGQVGLSRD